jgi:hypothetical protein
MYIYNILILWKPLIWATKIAIVDETWDPTATTAVPLSRAHIIDLSHDS